VTLVSVAPTHTRRGLLTRMMRRQLTELHERGGEPVAALWASESTIYGRFGYGLATRHGRLRCRTHDVRLRTAADPRDRRIRLAPAADETVRGEVAAVHERARRDRVGFVERPGPWTAFALHDPPAERGGATALQVAVHDGEAGVDGYAVYATKREWGVTGPAGEVHVREMVAETPGAYAALWGFLLSVDLTTSLSWGITSPDEPLRHLVETSDHVETSLGDNLWVRVVDLPRALGARRYATDVGLVLEVSDPFCPWNAGRWRVDAGPDGATAARTDEPADLALGATELGAVYLGGTAWATLAAAGRVTELRPGALAEADVAFGVRPAPYCPEVF
jgi:predicted acetyltransferase